MRFKHLFITTAMAFIAMSCGEKEEPATVKDIAGNYDGYVVANSAYTQNLLSEDETVSIAENTDGTATVSFTSATFGELSIPDARVDCEGETYTLSGKGTAKMGMGGNISSYDCVFTATVKTKDDAVMRFSVPSVMGGLTIDFHTGEAPAVTE